MSYYLLDRRNPNGDHFYSSRNAPLIAITVHITAGAEDLDTLADQSAENVTAYAANTDRDVSWHSSSDADTFLYLLPPHYTAWHATAYNSCTYGHEISKRHTDWRTVPAEWRKKTLQKAAECLRPVVEQYKIPLRKATRAEVDRAKATGQPAGFVSHAELQPQDRTDPGWVGNVDTFPWDEFFSYFYPEEEEMIFSNTVMLPPTAVDAYERVNIGMPWNGPSGVMDGGEVFACVIAADKGMKIRLAHFQVRKPNDAHPEEMVAPNTVLGENADTGGQLAPNSTRSLVLEYSAPQGGSVVIEGKK